MTETHLRCLPLPEMECRAGSPPEAVLIDSLLSVDQYRGSDKAADSDEKPGRDITEVAAATELILPKGSLRTTSTVRNTHTRTHTKTIHKCSSVFLNDPSVLLDSQCSTLPTARLSARLSADWRGLAGEPVQETPQWHSGRRNGPGQNCPDCGLHGPLGWPGRSVYS